MTFIGVCKKTLAVLLTVTLLLSCMVWSGMVAGTGDTFSWVFGKAIGSQNKSYLSYWNGTTNNPNMSNWPGISQPVAIADGIDGDTHAFELGYRTDYTETSMDSGRFAVMSLPNNTGATWNGRQDGKTIYLEVGQVYEFTVTYRVSGTNAAGTGGKLCYVDSLGALDDYKYLVDDTAKDLTTLATFAASQTGWTTATAYVKPTGSASGACIMLQMDDHTKRSGTKVQVGKITATAVDSIPEQADATYTYPIDDLTAANITGNGSGKVVKTGSEYDRNGKANGKGMYMHMNQPYHAAANKNAARFWLENAAGKLQGTVGNRYVVTAWVKSMLTETATFYWAIGTHDAAATNASNNNFQETSFEDNRVSLQPGVWTKLTATIDALTGSGGTVHYMSFAGGFADAKNGQYVYADDITIKEYVVEAEVPPTPAETPEGVLQGVQDFEHGTLSDFTVITNNRGKFDGVVTEENLTANGGKSLKTTIKDTWNSQRERPRLVIKLGDATTASNFKVERGAAYNLSFWVKTTAKDNYFAFYVATMGVSDLSSMINATSGTCHTMQAISATVGGKAVTMHSNGLEVSASTLEKDQWTQVIVNIPAVTLDAAGEDNFLELGFTSAKSADTANWNDTPYYVDDIALYKVSRQCTVSYETNGASNVTPTVGEKNTTIELPDTLTKLGYRLEGWYTDAAFGTKVTSPYTLTDTAVTLYAKWVKDLPTTMTLVQDFEEASTVDEFATNVKKPFVLATDKSAGNGSHSLKATIKRTYNYNFGRPLFALQMNGDTAPLQVVPGACATVSFKIMATRDVGNVGYMLDTVNDLSVLDDNPTSSSAADPLRTMQVLSSTSAGTLNSRGNEVTGVALRANEWLTVTAEIPTLVAHGSGAQYLVLAIGDQDSYNEIESYDLYVDDILITTTVGGQYTQVVYDTMGGDKKENGVGIIWTDITATATRDGYTFDGWYTDATCTVPVTTYPVAETVTLYAGWRLPSADVMDMEVDPGFVPQVYMDMNLDETNVQAYYSGTTNSSKSNAAEFAPVRDGAAGTVMKGSLLSYANTTSYAYGFRLVGKDSTSTGYELETGKSYSLAFRYKVESLPVEGISIRAVEGSINWNGPTFNSRYNHGAVALKAEDVGAGWKEARINFFAELGDVGIHLVLDAAQYNDRADVVVSFDDIRLESFQVTTFTTTASVERVEGEQNHTPDGNAAIKFTSTERGYAPRVVYASQIGDRAFRVGNIQIATAWLYSAQDTTATVVAVSDVSLDGMEGMSAAQELGSVTVPLKGGQWTRVELEYGLVAIAGNDTSYVSLRVNTDHGGIVYVDDITVGDYYSDHTKVQTYEEVKVGTHSNTSRVDGTLHGLNATTVVSGKGFEGSGHSLKLDMRSDLLDDVSRLVLFVDKKDVTATVGGGYLVTFRAMVEQDMDVSFALGTSETVDLSDRAEGANPEETGATSTVSMTANKWQGVSVYVAELQGRNPEQCTDPYITLAAWFDGAAEDNSASVYIDDVAIKAYNEPSAATKNILCLEDVDAFGFGKSLNLSRNGTMEVSVNTNHTVGGYYSLRVMSEGTAAISGGARPQFNILNGAGDAIRVEAGTGYKVTFWLRVPEGSANTTVRYWLAVTDSTTAYTTGTEKNAEVVYETSAFEGSTSRWVQVGVMLEDLERSGYLRLGICGATEDKMEFYLDDIRVFEQKTYELTGEETVQDYENYNIEDNDFIRNGVGYVTDEYNHTEGGSKSLRLEGISWAGANRNQMMLVDPATHRPYEFKKGENYNLSFWVYCPLGQVDAFNLNAWIWGTDNVNEAFVTADDKNGKGETFEYDDTWTPVSNDGDFIAGEWNKYSITFTAKNGKYMLMGLTNNAIWVGGYVYYVDDMQISIPERAVITYDPNGGSFDEDPRLNDKGQYVEDAFVGLKATGPNLDPYRDGKEFKGWAFDKDGKQVFNLLDDVVPSAKVTLYAIWGDYAKNPYDQIGNKGDDDEDVKYKTEMQYDRVWVGNAEIPTLDCTDNLTIKDAETVELLPSDKDSGDYSRMPAWLIIVIVTAGVLIVAGGAVLALLLFKKKSVNDKEVA